MNLIIILALLASGMTTGTVVIHDGGALVISGWADVDLALEASVYSAAAVDGLMTYEGEANCVSSFCVYNDTTPSRVYWFRRGSRFHGPLFNTTGPVVYRALVPIVREEMQP